MKWYFLNICPSKTPECATASATPWAPTTKKSTRTHTQLVSTESFIASNPALGLVCVCMRQLLYILHRPSSAPFTQLSSARKGCDANGKRALPGFTSWCTSWRATSARFHGQCKGTRGWYEHHERERQKFKLVDALVWLFQFTCTLRPTKFTSAKASLPCSEEAMVAIDLTMDQGVLNQTPWVRL